MGRILQFRTRIGIDGEARGAAAAREVAPWAPAPPRRLDERRIEHRRRMLAFLAVSAVRRAAQVNQT